MLSVIYAESFMLSVIMLSVAMLSVVMLNVVATTDEQKSRLETRP
jgi:hypothetical protein